MKNLLSSGWIIKHKKLWVVASGKNIFPEQMIVLVLKTQLIISRI